MPLKIVAWLCPPHYRHNIFSNYKHLTHPFISHNTIALNIGKVKITLDGKTDINWLANLVVQLA
jgi:hypothetical protein